MVVKRRRSAHQLLTALCALSVCLCVWQWSTSIMSPLPYPAVQSSSSVASSATPASASSQASLPASKAHVPDATDYSTLIDLDDFKFDRLPLPCPRDRPRPLLIALVHSAPGNSLKRWTIRETWGSVGDGGGDVRVVFLVGRVRDARLRDEIEREADAHGDVVQGSFVDDYRNMTYKHAMGLKFVLYHCPQAMYVLKTDDDVFVNTPALRRFLSDVLPLRGARGLIMCTLFPHSRVKRSYRSKWRVSPLEFAAKLYPPYCSGWAILYAPDVVSTLYREVQRAPYFWIDDVHVTGTLAERVGLVHTPADRYVLGADRLRRVVAGTDRLEDDDDDEDAAEFLYGPPDLSPEKIVALWKAVRRRETV